MGGFNEELHRNLDSEEEREICVHVLASVEQEVQRAIERHGWRVEDGRRQILAAGLRAVEGWTQPGKSLEAMTLEEQLAFHRDRAASLDAAYATMKFLAYQVMNQNDALELNLKGLVPQLEGARTRVRDLEEEVRRLRALVPEGQREGGALILERAEPEPQHKSLGEKLRDVFGR